MRRLIAILAAVAAATAAAPAEAATVKLMVVGKERVLQAPKDVRLKARAVRVGGRRCRVGARTPLSVLAAAKLRVKLRDYAACDRRPRNAGGLYVRAIGGERERGTGGWVYKAGRRAGTAGGGDHRLRPGQRVTWFWCELEAAGCRRTLELRPDRRAAAPGEPLRVTVRGYDDFGRGVPVEGALVRLGSAIEATGPDGVAVLTVPPAAGRLALEAERDGMVPAFPVKVRIG